MSTHLTNSLKRNVKDLKSQLHIKETECQQLKKNLKATKISEIEVEMKIYVDECTRLRHMLEEVLRSRDPLSDP